VLAANLVGAIGLEGNLKASPINDLHSSRAEPVPLAPPVSPFISPDISLESGDNIHCYSPATQRWNACRSM